ncbi:MAG: hypothetical protein RR531_08990 [Longicatena sp.]
MKTTNIKIFLDEITRNPDGSYSIYWGYDNLKNKTITIDEDDTYLYLQNGVAITQPTFIPLIFHPGVHHRFFCTIINQKTSMIWKFFEHTLKIDTSIIPMC